MKETRAYARLKRLHPRAHWQRVEGWATTGAFDTNACLRGVEVWVENKQVELPARTKTKLRVRVRKTQIVWELERRRAGGRTYVALLVGKHLLLLPGSSLAALAEGMTYDQLKMFELSQATLFEPGGAVFASEHRGLV